MWQTMPQGLHNSLGLGNNGVHRGRRYAVHYTHRCALCVNPSKALLWGLGSAGGGLGAIL